MAPRKSVVDPAAVQDQNATIRKSNRNSSLKLERANIRSQERLELALSTTRKRNRLGGQVTEPLSKRRNVISGNLENNAELQDEDSAGGQTDIAGIDDELITREPADKTTCPGDYEDTIEFSNKTEEDTAQISDDSEDSSHYFDAPETPEDENLPAESNLMTNEKSQLKIVELTEEIEKVSVENKELYSQFTLQAMDAVESANNVAQKMKLKNIVVQDENTRLQYENTRLQDENTRHQDENTRLQAENIEIRNESAELKQENAQLRVEKAQYQVKIVKYKNKNAQYKEKKAWYKEENAHYQEENAQYQEENAQYQEENAQYQEENAQIKEENAEYQEENAKYEDENAQIKEENYNLHTENNWLQAENNWLHQQLQRKTYQCSQSGIRLSWGSSSLNTQHYSAKFS